MKLGDVVHRHLQAQTMMKSNDLAFHKRGTKRDISMIALMEYLYEISDQEEADGTFTKSCFKFLKFLMTHGYGMNEVMKYFITLRLPV